MATPTQRSQRDEKITAPTSFARGTVTATLKREESGVTSIAIDLSHVTGVKTEKVFSADCGRVAIRNGLPELHFGQLDIFNPKKLIRIVIIRFDTNLFVARATAYEQMIKDIGNGFVSSKRSVPENQAKSLFELAGDSQPPVALFDAGMELANRLGDRVTWIFLSNSALELHAALTGSGTTISMKADLEVIVPLTVGYEIMRAWQDLAIEMKARV